MPRWGERGKEMGTHTQGMKDEIRKTGTKNRGPNKQRRLYSLSDRDL